MKRIGFRLSCTWLLLMAISAGVEAQPVVHTATFAASAGTSSGTGVILRGTAGQPLTARADASGFRLQSAFWPRVVQAGPAAILAPALILPENGAENVLLEPTLRWAEVPGATSYQLHLALDAGFQQMVIDTSGLSRTSLQLSVLAELTQYHWRVRAVSGSVMSPFSEVNAFTTTSATSLEEEGVPQQFILHPNYPNPFNPSTRIEYEIPRHAHVIVRVYDALGRVVATLADAPHAPGRYGVTFEAGNLPSGTYMYHIEAGEYRFVQRMMLVK